MDKFIDSVTALWQRDGLNLITITLVVIMIKSIWAVRAPGPTLFMDELWYRLNASSIFELQVYANAHYPPLYPLVVAPALYFESWFKGMMLLNVFWSSLVIPATWFLARSAGVKYPLVAAALSAILPMHTIYSRHLMSENIFVPFFVLALALALRGSNRSLIEALMFGVILGFSHLTKYLFLPAVPTLFAVWLFVGRKLSREVPAHNIIRSCGSIFLALFGYAILLLFWVVYARYSGFGWGEMFGFGIPGKWLNVPISLDSFIMWAVAYTSYIMLAWLPIWAAIFFWVSQLISRPFRNQMSPCQSHFVFSSIFLLGGYWLLAVQHSFRSPYNYPVPLYIIGRYLMHIAPLMLVLGVMCLEKIHTLEPKLKYLRAVWGTVVIAFLASLAWWILFNNGIWEFPGWFSKISLNAVGVGELSSGPVFIAVLASAISLFPLIARFPKIKVPLLALPIFFALLINLYFSTKTMANVSVARHAQELAVVCTGLRQNGSPAKIRFDVNGLSEKSLGFGLQFFKITKNQFSIKKVSTEEGVDLSLTAGPTLLLTSAPFDIQPLHEYVINNDTFRIFRIDDKLEFLRPRIIAFGPMSVIAGKSFNVQPSGNSAMWLKLASASRRTYLKFDNHKLKLTFGDDLVVSVGIPLEYVGLPRTAKLRLFDPITNLESASVDFNISPQLLSK